MASPNPNVRLIWVQKHPDSPEDRVAIYDRDPSHPATRGNPAGELYIADRFPRLVAETVSINQKLQRSQGGPSDLHVLREDEAQKILKEMEEAYQQQQDEAREAAMVAQGARPLQMPPEVAAWMANSGMVVMPASAFASGEIKAPSGSKSSSSASDAKKAATEASPNPSGGTRSGRSAGDSGAESTGVSTAVESGPTPGTDEGPGEGDKAGDKEGATTSEKPADENASPPRSPRAGR